jgi:uncharacterized protein YjbK
MIPVLLLTLLFLYGRAQLCDAYFPIEEGSTVEMKQYDEKDKLTGGSLQTVLKKTVLPTGLKLLVKTQVFDAKDKESGTMESELRCENGVFYFDMKKFMDQSQMSEMKDMEMEVESADMEVPGNLTVGQTLKDASITMKMSSNGMQMFTMTVNVTNRKVEGQEKITTPAGTFDCYKISYDIMTKVMFKVEAKSIDWMARDVGVVRSESYNAKGKLTGYTLMTALNRK